MKTRQTVFSIAITVFLSSFGQAMDEKSTELQMDASVLSEGNIFNLLEDMRSSPTFLDTYTSLKIKEEFFGSQFLKSTYPTLIDNTSITSLDIIDSSIACHDFDLISDLLTHNETITSLTIVGFRLGPKAAETFRNSLKLTTTLRSLTLKKGYVTSEIIAILAEGFEYNTSITYLDLSTNLISDNGINPLCTALSRNTTLRHLSLNQNLFTGFPVGLHTLIETSSTLRSLSLMDNMIQNDVDNIWKSLEKNNTLTALNIGRNGITQVLHYNSMAAMLKINTSLKSLNLQDQGRGGITLNGLSCIQKALSLTSTLETLNLNNNLTNGRQATKILGFLRVNPKITIHCSPKDPHYLTKRMINKLKKGGARLIMDEADLCPIDTS